ncbi:MAG: hypothetical protein R2862_03480 [Thermoanaerobaculia bacterium]
MFVLTEIGIVVALYALNRVIPETWQSLRRATAALVGIASLVAIADSGLAIARARGALALAEKPQVSPVLESDDQAIGGASTSAKEVSVTRADGGSITTHLGYGYAVAKGSTLRREWIAIHDNRLPVQLVGTPGVDTVYSSKDYGGEYRYRAKFELQVKEPVQAIELRFLTFDVWGAHVRSLSFEQVQDLPVGTSQLTGEWRLFDENAVETHYASVGYIARVRLADGRILEMDTLPVLQEARKFSNKFEAEDLDPKEPKPGQKGS